MHKPQPTFHAVPSTPLETMYSTPEQASTMATVRRAHQIVDAMNCALTRADSLVALLENGVDSGYSTAKVTKGGLCALQGQLDQMRMLFSALDEGEAKQ